ncbi:DUF3854 domain-containing protein [Micrococcaceae bacterium Sec7.4]
MTSSTITNAVPTDVSARFLSTEHRGFFMARAIDPVLAQAYTASDVDDLPEELKFHAEKHGAEIFPGIVFEHIDMRGMVTPQYRPDAKGTWGKYLFGRGAFNGPFFHRSQLHLVGKLHRIAIIEGTAQLRAAITAATNDGSLEEVLFIGVPGCTGGVKDHLHSNDWNDAIPDKNEKSNPKGCDIVIVFDADVASKLAVWKSADKLMKYIELTAGAKVRIAEIPAYANIGLDDFLANQPDGRRSRTLEKMLTTAPKKMPRRPAAALAKRTPGADQATMDFTAGVTAFPATDYAGTMVPGRILMSAAVRIVRSYATYNDLDPEIPQFMTYDLEITTKITGVLKTHIIRNIGELELQNPRTWLNRIPGGAGANITFDSRDAEKIVNSIRITSTQQMVERLERKGLIVDSFGVIRYMGADGSIGPEDKTTDLVARIGEKKMSKVSFADPHAMSDDEKRAAFRHVFAQWDLMVDPTAFLLVLGASVCAVHGMEPKGTTGSFGDTGSGKTTIFFSNASMWGPTAGMANFESSKGVTGQLGAGLENAICLVDDFQDLSSGSQGNLEEKQESLNMLLRRGYGGADYARSRLGRDQASGKFGVDAADPSSPFFAVTMELNAIPYGMKSSMERLLLAEVTQANSFRTSEDAHAAMALNKSPLSGQAMAIIIGEVVKKANVSGLYINGEETGYDAHARLANYKQLSELRRRTTQAGLEESHPGMATPRSYEVASTPMYGVMEFIQKAAAVDALTGDEYRARRTQAAECIMAASFAWEAQVLNRARSNGEPLSRLSDAVTAGNYVLAENYRDAGTAAHERGVRVLGWKAVFRGEPIVVINPSEAVKILRAKDVATLEKILVPHLVTDSKGNKKPALNVAGKPGAKKRMWAIKLESWEGGSTNLDATDVEAELLDDRTF